jgi:glycosyltransferase involved in cell wall biosynthesis
MKKLCLIFDSASHYRSAIYQAIDANFECDWYFKKTSADDSIKEMDLSKIKRWRYCKSYGRNDRLYWLGGLISNLFKKQYGTYFTLIESRSASCWLFLLLHKLFFRKKKVYGWGHGWLCKKTGLQAKLDVIKYNSLDGMFVYNNRSKNLLIQAGVLPHKLHVIYNTLDYDKQIVLRNKMNQTSIYQNHWRNSHPTLLFVGRLTRVKRLDLLLEAIYHLKLRGVAYNLVLIGDGECRDELNQFARQYGIEPQLWFYGPCYDEEKNAELIYNADLCVSPGNVGLTAMHAMMFGCPVLTHDNFSMQMPEFEAICAGQTGDFFAYNDVEDLAKKIHHWISTSCHQRDEVRAACYREIDSKWNYHNQIKLLTSIIKL